MKHLIMYYAFLCVGLILSSCEKNPVPADQELEVESAVPESVRSELSARGHNVLEVRAVAGGMNGIVFDSEAHTMTGAACWRADGSPAALSGGPARPGVRFRTTVSR